MNRIALGLALLQVKNVCLASHSSVNSLLWTKNTVQRKLFRERGSLSHVSPNK